jgi:hypothetical protein
MHAEVGDWLVVNSHAEGRPIRKATILAVHPGGQPPYTVRWLDNDHEALVFPGPDAEVVSAARQIEIDRMRNERLDQVQSDITTEHSSAPSTGD